MSKEMGVIILGLLVIIIPYLGLPISWRTILLVIVGVGITIIGFLLRGEVISKGTAGSEKHHFAEPTKTIEQE